ncbi:hypothetical protein [Streptomyces sulfonofaciens]|nr:hypothetical protein [Streptomyces sulfonofaciens]
MVATHALLGHETRALHATRLDLSPGALEVVHGLLRHTLHLEE